VTTTLELPPQWVAEIAAAVSRQIDDDGRWVTVAGLADWLGCKPGHIYDLRERGLPARRLKTDGTPSKRLYFDLREVSAWMAHESVVA
jgi:hypothetical protein